MSIRFHVRSTRPLGIIVAVLVIAASFVSSESTANAATGDISTIAGLPCCGGGSGNGGLAVNAEIQNNAQIAVDGSGNIYLAESRTIRKIDKRTGIIDAVAGPGSGSNYNGDGMLAVDASFTASDVAIDPYDNVFIADSLNERIRRVDAQSGLISTVAGTGVTGFAGDGGPAIAAQFDEPMSIAVDGAGNVYVADRHNHRVRKIDASTGTITTVVGTGTAGFSGDGGLATVAEINFSGSARMASDLSGNLLIISTTDSSVRRVDATTGVITTVGNTFISGVRDAAFDDSGNIFVAALHQAFRVDGSTGTVTTVAGDGTSSGTGNFGDGGPATLAHLGNVNSIAVDSSGNLLIQHSSSGRRLRLVENIATATTVDLAVSASGSPATVDARETITYSISVTNGGPDTAPGARLYAALGTGTKFASANESQGFCTAAVDSVDCVLGPLASGASATVTIDVLAPLVSGGIATTFAALTGAMDSSSANDIVTVNTSVSALTGADLSLTQVPGATGVLDGELTWYLLTVVNEGPEAATDVVVTDTLPAGAVFSGASAECRGSGGTILCTKPSLAAGESDDFIVVVTAPLGATSLSNTAVVAASGPEDRDASNNTSVATTVVSAALERLPDDWILQFGSTVSPSFAIARAVAIHGTDVIVVGNTGAALAGATQVGSSDLFVRKLAGDGSILWTTQIGIAGKQTSATGVAVDSGGNIYVIGTTNGAFPTKTYSGGGEDAIVVKLASDGTQI